MVVDGEINMVVQVAVVLKLTKVVDRVIDVVVVVVSGVIEILMVVV